ncbi:acetylglutamate kinase [Tenacibaculum sp. IB213877]|uniref:acetylglutamate kinase n=1 Tax=Tenacibaculum sp. IB213877 TaxID=3097351 RepID=UPI002A5A4A32|nr:acetylglutamate kinase [Tenacibaculum sp. IB213877]MDY0779221.1 acetylglutamate kinase [Tenacibaculum sp. IB213877]
METLKIIKIGGNIIDNPILLDEFLSDFSKLDSPKILVHGGGKLASELSLKMGIAPNLINGRRVTDTETLDIITMVYAGKINKQIVAKLQANQCNALGFSGADGNSIIAKKRPITDIDYGFVGDVTKVNTELIEMLLLNGVSPVFCAISHDENGQLLNTNADTIATELAIALASKYNVELLYCFEKNGVLRNVEDESSVITKINQQQYDNLKAEKVIHSGMLPKIDNCFYAVNNGVKKVSIGNSKMPFNSTEKCTTIQL